jgi:hypothetical protein
VPATPSRLAVDLSGGLIRVVEGAPGGPIRCGSGGTPANSLVAGKVGDVSAVGSALRQLLARTEILATRASIAVSDSVATFRVIRVPEGATDQDVDAIVTKELHMDPERMATQWTEVGGAEGRLVYAVAWDRSLVKLVTDAARVAGLEPVVVDLKSACIARTVLEPSCVVLDLSSDPVEIVLIDGSVPRVWHSYGSEAHGGNSVGPSIVGPLRSVLRFYERRRDTSFPADAPVLVAGEQVLSAQALDSLSALVEHPVRLLPLPARVPQDVRYPTYLACLGLLMRRT